MIWMLTGVGVRDLIDFIRIKPDFSLATVEDRGCEAFLVAQVDPINITISQYQVK